MSRKRKEPGGNPAPNQIDPATKKISKGKPLGKSNSASADDEKKERGPSRKKTQRVFELKLMDGSIVNPREPLNRRVALCIDGENADVVSLKLDSNVSRNRQAKTWSKQFRLKESDVLDKLRNAALAVTADNKKKEIERIKARWTAAKSPPPPPTPISLSQARQVFNKWLEDTDSDLLDVVFGAVMAHRLDGDPVWLFIVGAPGDGKTEMIRALQRDPTIFMLSSLKPAALISGFQNDDGSDPSLLPKLDGKVLIVKDFTTVLTMPNEARAEILGTLRDAYDGEAGKAFGNGEVRSYVSRFGLLAAVTPVIESYWGVSQQLGERFLRLRLKSRGRVSKVGRALTNTDAETNMRGELAGAALGVLAQSGRTATVPTEIASRLIHLADFVSRARSEVSRDGKGTVQYMPIPEVGTRIGKALKKLAIGIAIARGLQAVDADVMRIVQRVAVDSVPSVRAKLLRVLWKLRDSFQPTSEIAETAEVNGDTARYWLDDLRLLEIVDRAAPAKNLHTWRLRAEFIDTMTLAGLGGDVPTPSPESYPHADDDAEQGGKSHPQPYSHVELDANGYADAMNDETDGRWADSPEEIKGGDSP
jgi:hypothetical protein